MGAMPWYHLASWWLNPAEALHELQAKLLKKNYNLSAELQRHLHSAREAIRVTEAEGDPYGILKEYRRYLTRLERIARRPLPTEPMEQVACLRQIWKAYGEGIGNVLDVSRVSNRRRAGVSCRLSLRAIRELFGTETPSRAQAEAAPGKIFDTLSRGESVCFPVYSANGHKPIGWYFVGYSID
jgi:hypothetical protein